MVTYVCNHKQNLHGKELDSSLKKNLALPLFRKCTDDKI